MSVNVVTQEDVVKPQAMPESQDQGEETKQSASEVTPQDETTEESETSDQDLEQTDDKSDELKADSDKEEKGQGAKKRIEKLVKQREEARRELEHWKAQAMKGQNQEHKPVQETPKQEAKQESSEGEPQEEQFDTYKDYLKAQVKWELAQEKKAQEQQAKELEQKTQAQKQAEEFKSKIDSFAQNTPDFFDVIEECDEKVSTSFHVQEAIRNSDMPAQVLYELAKNPTEIERLNKLSVIAAAKEIGKIEARLSSQTESKEEKQTQEKPQPKITKAPKPLNPVGSKGNSKTWSLYDPDIPQAEFEKLLRAKKG